MVNSGVTLYVVEGTIVTIDSTEFVSLPQKPIFSITEGTTTSVLVNDTYKGGTMGSVNPMNVSLTAVNAWPSGISLSSSGEILVASGTPANQYSLEYKICAWVNSTICNNANINLLVIDAFVMDEENDSDGDGISDAVECGICASGNLFENGSFELPVISSNF